MNWSRQQIDEINREIVGKPWEDGAEGPDAFGCWGLVRHVKHAYYGLELPAVPISSHDLRECRETIQAMRVSRDYWHPIEHPIDGAGVVMGAGGGLHVGVYLDIDGGVILHSQVGIGVRSGPPLYSGWRKHAYYCFNDECLCKPQLSFT